MLSQEQYEKVKEAVKILKAELATLAPASPDDKPVKLGLHKFGSFIVKRTRSRMVKNPAIPEGSVLIPERVVVRFSASKTWLAEFNGDGEDK